MTRCVCTIRKAFPAIWSECTSPSQTIDNFCHVSVQASTTDRSRTYHLFYCHSRRTRTNRWFSMGSLWPARLLLKFFRLRNTAGCFGSAFLLDYAVRGKLGNFITSFVFTRKKKLMMMICLIVSLFLIARSLYIPIRLFSPTAAVLEPQSLRQTTWKRWRSENQFFFHGNINWNSRPLFLERERGRKVENCFFFLHGQRKAKPEKSHKKALFIIEGGKIPKKGVPVEAKNERLTPFIHQTWHFWLVFRLASSLCLHKQWPIFCSWISGFFSSV